MRRARCVVPVAVVSKVRTGRVETLAAMSLNLAGVGAGGYLCFVAGSTYSLLKETRGVAAPGPADRDCGCG